MAVFAGFCLQSAARLGEPSSQDRGDPPGVVGYLRGPGTVVRCRNCSAMLMVISQIRGVNCVDLGGLIALDPGQGG
jgi:hypothetical protein